MIERGRHLRLSVASATRRLRSRLVPKPANDSRQTDSRRFQWLARPAFWLGLNPSSTVLLEVEDRQSGEIHRTALVLVTLDRNHYVVSREGEAEWVRNVRASEGEAVIRRRNSLPVKLVEVPVEERPRVIAAYLNQAKGAGSEATEQEAHASFGLDPDPSLDEIAAIAEHHAVFRILRRANEPTARQAQREGEMVRIEAERGEMPIYLATPTGAGPWPGVVLIHDIFGMTTDLKNHADWLASEGFLAAAPDLQYWGLRTRCLFATLRQMSAREGSLFNDVTSLQRWLADREDCTGKIGVMGFCLGGGFAVLLSSGYGYGASSVNYGGVPEDALTLLANACPMVGSFGGKDEGLADAPIRLEQVLSEHGIDHDIKVYPDAGHSFLNDHVRSEIPLWAVVMGARSESPYHEASAVDARKRIVAFFETHLGE